jgi:cell division protease FtsH
MKSAIEHANVLLKELNELCYGLLHAYEPVLRAIADELLERETVPGETVYRLIKEHKSALKIVHEPAAA